jgi:predicted DNA-binding protein YlxM (UPF0122 family)
MMRDLYENVSQETIAVAGSHRAEIELLRGRLKLLDGKDKILMTMYMENCNSIRQIARLLDVDEMKIARRIQKLTKSLIDSEYLECLRARDRFTSNQLNIARDYFLSGMSIRKIAAKRKRSCYCIRKIILDIQNLVRTGQA